MKLEINIGKRHLYILLALAILFGIAVIAYDPLYNLNADKTIPAEVGSHDLRFISNGTHSVDADEDGIIDVAEWANVSGSGWSRNGSNIYYTAGNVSIGNSSLKYQLDIGGIGDGNINVKGFCINGVCITNWDDIQIK